MKKMKGWTVALAALITLLTAAGTLCGSVARRAGEPALYAADSRAAVAAMLDTAEEAQVTAYVGLDDQQQQEAAKQLASYMREGNANTPPDVLVTFETEPASVLNEKERRHLADVRGIVAGCARAGSTCIALAAGLAVVCAWVSAGLAHRTRTALGGVALGALALVVCGAALALALRAQGFAALFVRLHTLLFTNDWWLLDPQTDLLIRMMPQTLFERAAVAVLRDTAVTFAATCALLAAIYGVTGGMIRRHLTEEQHD